MILKCSCYHKFQDKEHGVGLRVHNWAAKASGGDSKPGYRCTVCLSVKAPGAANVNIQTD